jgi:serine/threonine protein kinase
VDEVPAAHLSGCVLDGGWTVGERATKSVNGTGGHFSVCYVAHHDDGRSAFMKALNFNASADPSRPLIDQLSEFTSAYVFERNLLAECCAKKMSRIVTLLGYGEVRVQGAPPVLQDVPYLIFEMAEGDIYAFQERSENLDAAWFFQVVKHALEGIGQLHSRKVAHQDLKPSNVLTQSEGAEMKLGDLGRAEWTGVDTWWSDFPVPGAVVYAPPEQQYGYFGRTWEERRAADLYLAGSLGAQLFLGHCMSSMIADRLPEACRPNKWQGSQDELTAYLVAAHADVITDLESEVLARTGHEENARQYAIAVSQMTHPDLSLRGHPRDRAATTSSFAVQRFVSAMDLFSTRARIRALGEQVAGA